MLTFLNGENSDSYKMAVCLDNKLKLIGYGFNYYQILGLDINYTREELDENYKNLMDLMSNNNVLEEEKNLYLAIKNHNEKADNLENYIKSLFVLIQPIAEFFDKVLVMDKDENIKNNRIALLNLLKAKFDVVCDFEKL